MRELVTPALVGKELCSVRSDGQMASSMMSMHDAPMYVLMLVVRVNVLDDERIDPRPGQAHPK